MKQFLWFHIPKKTEYGGPQFREGLELGLLLAGLVYVITGLILILVRSAPR